jgi:hypothetical protein
MKNTTISNSSGCGKVPKKWRSGFLSLVALLCVTMGYSQGYVSIGTQSSQSGAFGASPVSGYYTSRHIQVVYTAAELTAAGGIAGNITKLAWQVTETYGGGALPNYTVKMGHIATADIPTTAFVTGLTTVKTPHNYTPVLGFNDITFDTPFAWNGTGNVVVDICFSAAPYIANYGQCALYVGATNSNRSQQADGVDLCASATANTTQATKPVVRLNMAVVSCLPPTAIAAAATSYTAASLAWTASSSAPASGYQYYYSTTNTVPATTATPSGTVAAGVTTAALTGLTFGSTYYVWVRSACSATSQSSWGGPTSFTVNYCTPAPSSQDGTGITNFTMGTINNTTVSETGYYGNYSAQVNNAALGSTVNFSITYATGFTYATKIWVDWNNDTDFNDAGEEVYSGESLAPNPTTLSGSFVVPVTASVGNHRVRVGGVDVGPVTPCYNGTYGVFEDYTINAFMPPAPVITGFTPASYCAATGAITVTGTNLGNATLKVGTTTVPTTTNTATQIVASVPAGVSGVVSVTTVAGTATTTSTFVVSAPATFSLSAATASVCAGATSPLVTITAGASSFNTYAWSPSTGVSGSAAAGWTFTPAATTTYTLTASQSAGPCVVTATYVVTVNPLPSAVVVTPATTTACLNQPVALVASGGVSAIPATYCIPTLGAFTSGATDDYLNNFSFANITNNNSGDAASDYTFYSALTANVTGGTSYTISLQPGQLFGQQFRVWIDYNADGVYADNESVFNTTTASTATVTGTIVIPATALNGLTRMRVLCSWNTVSAVGDDCSWTGYGEYEEYRVNITGAVNPVNYAWAPAAGLYTNAAATTPYTAGSFAVTVYAKPTATATYTATAATPLGCTATGTATVTVTNTAAPTAVSPQAYTTLTYTSNLQATGTGLQWYTAATGGTALAATAPITSATYYVSQTVNGCESTTRTAVIVTVILPEMDFVNLQWPATLTVVQGTAGQVYAQGYEPGVTPGAGPGIGVTAWIGVSDTNTDPSTWTTWIPATFNTQVGNNDEYVAAIGATLAPGTYYYASRFKLLEGPYKYGGYSATGGGFWSAANVNGVLTVTCGTAAPVAVAAQSFCNTATVADLAATGTSVQWFAAATGGTALTATTALVSGSTYYAGQTIGCESLTRTAVTVTITASAAPTGDATQEFTVQGLVSGLEATGTGIIWYDAATGGVALSGTTALTDGGVYYASQTINGCESQTRFAVTVALVAYSLDFVNLQWPAEITVVQGSDATVYAQVFEANVTPGAGPGVGVTVMVAISTENTDPSTWTTWMPMTFSSQVGSNDEFMAQIGAGLEPGTYYYAVAGQLFDGPYTYGGYSATGGGTWNGTTNVSGVLTVLCYTAAPFAVQDQQVFCNSATVAGLSATGSEIQWYAAASGGIALSADAALIDGTVYYASQTVNGCESMGRIGVTAYVNVVAAPTGDAEQVVNYYEGDVATIDGIVAESNGTITWYYTEEEALAGVNPIPAGTEIESGTYYGIASNGTCTSTTAFAVTVETVLGAGHFDVASFSYYPNPVKDVLTVAYSQEITTVNVFNLLGQQVIALVPNANEVKVDMTALAEGTYIMNVTTGNTVKTIKVVKRQ